MFSVINSWSINVNLYFISHSDKRLLNLTLKIWGKKRQIFEWFIDFICIFPYLIQIVQHTLFAFIQSLQYSVLVYTYKYYFCNNNKYLNKKCHYYMIYEHALLKEGNELFKGSVLVKMYVLDCKMLSTCCSSTLTIYMFISPAWFRDETEAGKVGYVETCHKWMVVYKLNFTCMCNILILKQLNMKQKYPSTYPVRRICEQN
jgi:hypothetical protein